MVDPPNSAPQYIDDSRMIAAVGSSVKVSGMRSDTPFGAPRPGSTPTTRPRSTPATISSMWVGVIATPKPCMRRSKLLMSMRLQ